MAGANAGWGVVTVRLVRRRRLPEDLATRFAAFADVLGAVEKANGAMADTVPSSRVPGRPLLGALHEFGELLSEAASRMDAWRDPRVENEWLRCDVAIRSALDLAERLRLEERDPEGFEALVGSVGELIGPLEDAFQSAVERFRDLRTSLR